MKTKRRETDPFKFKQFSVDHGMSSMKVGVDGVLVGAWGNVDGKKGLDVGCGCGVIALIAAQRNPEAEILAIDIHQPSVSEARRNFTASPWSARLSAEKVDINEMEKDERAWASLDFILSNPPFFHSGVDNPETPREKARHEDSLSPSTLIGIAGTLLKENGTLSMILPAERLEELKDQVIEKACGMRMEKALLVANRRGHKPKRALVCLRKTDEKDYTEDILYICGPDGAYSDEYRGLTGAFYINF